MTLPEVRAPRIFPSVSAKKTWAEELKGFRAKARMTQTEASAGLGVPLRTLQNWECGRDVPRGLAMAYVRQQMKERRG